MTSKELNIDDLLIDTALSAVKNQFRSHRFKSKLHRSDVQDYDLKECIGEGGFCKVRRATHKPTGEVVAVKIFSKSRFSEDQLNSFEKQIQIQKQVLHSHIAQVYEVIRKEDKIYLIMEHCSNGELFNHINQKGSLPEQEAGRIFNQILSALEYLRECNICHRDIKTENIMLDADWNVKIIDFGFSCLSKPDQLRTTICGTPSYTPPEIIKRAAYKPELIDVWCLGVSLYVMLAAELPFEGTSSDMKNRLITECKYKFPPHFSSRVKLLLSRIFVDQKLRVTIPDLKASEFCRVNTQANPKFVNFKTEKLALEQLVLERVENELNIKSHLIQQSIENGNLDRYTAIYYLILKRHNRDRQVQIEASQFKKQRLSIQKLEPLILTPGILRKEANFTFRDTRKAGLPDFQLRRKTVEIRKSRLRRDSPDSPRRLLDCLGAYNKKN